MKRNRKLKLIIKKTLFIFFLINFLTIILFSIFSFAQQKTEASAERKKQLDEINEMKKNKDGDILKKLKEKSKHPDPLVRGESVKAIAKSGNKEAYTELSIFLDSEDNNTRYGAIEGMGELKDKRAIPKLIKLLSHKDMITRWKTAEVLKNFKDDRVVNSLLKTAKDETENVYVRRSAINSIIEIDAKKYIKELKEIENSKNKEISIYAEKAVEYLNRK